MILLYRILALVVSSGLCVVVIEGVAALTTETPVSYPIYYPGEFPNRASERFNADPRVGWRMRPSLSFRYALHEKEELTYTAGPDGFRTNASPAAVRGRIVVAGDSQAFGLGVPADETLSSWLVHSLDVDVHTIAQPGYAVDQIWQSIRHEGLALKPDLVIVGLFPADFWRSFTAFRRFEGFNKPTFRVIGGALSQLRAEDAPPVFWRWVQRRSWLLEGARRADAWLGRRYGIGNWWRLNRHILDEIRADCSKAGVRVLFLHVPYRGGQTFPALARYMHETQSDYIDGNNVFESRQASMYIPRDAHLSAQGHAALARAVAGWVHQNPGVIGASTR